MDKIFVYSGTGNSYASAKQIAGQLGMQVVHITRELAESKLVYAGETCIIIFPVYAYGLPKTVRTFIKSASFNVKYMAILSTIGSHHGGALAEAIRLLKRRKQKVAYSKGIKSVENFVHMFKLPPAGQIEATVKKQYEITKQLSENISAGKQNRRLTFRPGSCFVSFFFRRVTGTFAKHYKFLDSCTNCGVCARVCPSRAIEMLPDRPKPNLNPKRCDHCQACMQLCPQHAISFGKITPTARRYMHPDTTLGELFKRESV
jgi:ferredoxin